MFSSKTFIRFLYTSHRSTASDPNDFFKHGNNEHLYEIKKKYNDKFLKEKYQNLF